MTSMETDLAARDGQSHETSQHSGPDDASPQEKSEEASQVSSGHKKRYDIDIFKGWCKSCGICAAFCPRECIGIDEDGAPFIREAERCAGCGWCEAHCPDFAISVHPRKPAARSAPDE